MPTGESLLPPTETLSAEELEDFTERLLNAQKFATHDRPRCVEVARWGRRGDKQDGIDFAGWLSPVCQGELRPVVRDEFWCASGALLAAAPGTVARRMIAAATSPFACDAALKRASEIDGRAWGVRLAGLDASSVLHLIDRTDWKGYTSQQIVTGIATSHPLVVLKHLAETDSVPVLLDEHVEGLAEALESHGEILARWLVGRAGSAPFSSRSSVVAIALADGLGAATANALEHLAPDLDEDALVRLFVTLEPLGGASALSTWPQQRPALARALLRGAHALGARAVQSTIASLESAMAVRSWSSVNGVSGELQRALDVTITRAVDEPDEELQGMFEKARKRIVAQSDDQMRQYAADE